MDNCLRRTSLDVRSTSLLASKRWADGSQVSGQYFEYAHSFIGNRALIYNGGGWYASYFPDSVNQYGSRQEPPEITILGLANRYATVTVSKDGTNQTVYRQGESQLKTGSNAKMTQTNYG